MAQLVERRSPKPQVPGSNPGAPAIEENNRAQPYKTGCALLLFYDSSANRLFLMSIEPYQFTLLMVAVCCAALGVVVWLGHLSVRQDLARHNERRAAARYAEQAHPEVWPPSPQPVKKRLSLDAGNYLFCLACQGIYNTGQVAVSGTECPQAACPGSASDMIAWNDLRRASSELPEAPQPGEIYRFQMPTGEIALIGDKDIAFSSMPNELGAAFGTVPHVPTNN